MPPVCARNRCRGNERRDIITTKKTHDVMSALLHAFNNFTLKICVQYYYAIVHFCYYLRRFLFMVIKPISIPYYWLHVVQSNIIATKKLLLDHNHRVGAINTAYCKSDVVLHSNTNYNYLLILLLHCYTTYENLLGLDIIHTHQQSRETNPVVTITVN